MRLAIVGCGFVADFYMKTLRLHPQLELAGVYDRDRERGNRFAAMHRIHAYGSLDELLADRSVLLVVNLTNPASHFEVSRACLEAGKHVYSEKPLALRMDEAEKLVAIAEERGLELSSAPCSLLSETAQTMGRALREGLVGRVRAVYAEIDDGLVHRMPYRRWISESGAPWPYHDEFRVGCTLEHAGYSLTWLAGFFGPARAVTAFASIQVPDKTADVPAAEVAPDFSVACIEFDGGIVARLTCSLIAPKDRQLRVFGDQGVLSTPDTWRYRSPVHLRRFVTIRRRMMLSPLRRTVRMLGTHLPKPGYRADSSMDFFRGVADMAEAITSRRPTRLSARFSLHATEVALAIDAARKSPGRVEMRTSFELPEPMVWAR